MIYVTRDTIKAANSTDQQTAGAAVEYLAKLNELKERPEFYNTALTNCTTNIILHIRAIEWHVPLSWKMLLSGYFPELVHKRGGLDKSLAFDDSRKQSLINKRSRDADVAADYSRRIRDGRGPAWNAREIGRNVVEELTYEPICKCLMTANR